MFSQSQQSMDIAHDENVCRLYEVGKVKDEADDQVSLDVLTCCSYKHPHM